MEAQQENQKLKGDIFGMTCEPFGLLIGSYNASSIERHSEGAGQAARACSEGDEEYGQSLMALRCHSRKYGGVGRSVQGCSTSLRAVEDVRMPRRCMRGMGHGEDTLYQS